MELTPCSGCRRHVRASEPACPFCGAASLSAARSGPSQRLSRAGLIAFALATGCSKPPAATEDPAIKTTKATTPPPDATTPPVVTAIAAPYGAPPRPPIDVVVTTVSSTIKDSPPVVARLLPGLRACADSSAMTYAGLAGEVELTVTTDATGNVSNTATKGTIKQPTLDACLASQARAIKWGGDGKLVLKVQISPKSPTPTPSASK